MTLSIVCRASFKLGKRRPTCRGVTVRFASGCEGIAPSDSAGSGDERSVVAEDHPSDALCQDNPRPPSPAAGTGGM